MSEGEKTDSAPAVPWTGADLVFLFLLSWFCQSAVVQLLLASGWFGWFYGADLVELGVSNDPAGTLARLRLSLWGACLGNLMALAATLAHICFIARARLADMGLTSQRLVRNILAGLLFAVIFAPGAYALQALALIVVKALGGEVEHHQFTTLGKEPLFAIEWVLLISAAVVVAPLWEELFYRGLVQPWVIDRQPTGGLVVLLVVVLLTGAARADNLRAALNKDTWAILVESLPLLILAWLIPVYIGLARWRVSAGGLFATAVLFAWVHVRVWPSPVPLLWLALGLGWLRWRTGSLVGPIVLHAVFNAIAVVALLSGLQM